MKFKKSRDEVCETLRGGLTDFIEADILSVFYETTPEAVADILPPGLLPYKRPIIVAGFNDFHRTNFEVPYLETALYVSCVHEKTGRPGFFVPAMTLDKDMGTILGREVGGYPKKVGSLKRERQGNHFEGCAERHGIPYFTIRADLNEAPNDPQLMDAIGELLTPPDPENHPGCTIIYNYLWPASLWVHLDDISKAPAPILYTVWKGKEPCDVQPEIGKGEVIYQPSKHDPWCSLPVVHTLGAIMTHNGINLSGAHSSEDEYPVDPAAYLPYAFYGFDADVSNETV